ncbi:MAG: hypothetical protein O2880_13095 [Proteobacteria bacterium]|nr:hypothetical protein [Pseudomonadota bacterium]
MDRPLSQSSVSLKLSEIQKRCQDLMSEELNELTLEDGEPSVVSVSYSYNPYDNNR